MFVEFFGDAIKTNAGLVLLPYFEFGEFEI
jgi:hypothetical protein